MTKLASSGSHVHVEQPQVERILSLIYNGCYLIYGRGANFIMGSKQGIENEVYRAPRIIYDGYSGGDTYKLAGPTSEKLEKHSIGSCV